MFMWMSAKTMCFLWMGNIVLGLAYISCFPVAQSTLPFVIGQIVAGVIGLLREWFVSKTLKHATDQSHQA
jgi:hypothetical protein